MVQLYIFIHLVWLLSQANCCQTCSKENLCPSSCVVFKEIKKFELENELQVKEAKEMINRCYELLNQESHNIEIEEMAKMSELRQLEDFIFTLNRRNREMNKEILDLKLKAEVENRQIINMQYEIAEQHQYLLEQVGMLPTTQQACEGRHCGTLRTSKGNQCRMIEAYQYPDCAGLYKAGHNVSGVYLIRPHPSKRPFKVYCNMDEAGGGWTVIQRRVDGTVNFDRNWDDYKYGFAQQGNLCAGEFWLGNKKLVYLSKTTFQTVRFKLTNWNNEMRIAQYMYFKVNEESSNFMLQISVYDEAVSNASDSISGRSYPDAFRRSINNMHFTTKDNDNDRLEHGNCASDITYSSLKKGQIETQNYSGSGGWWYNACHSANPNGKYFKGGRYNTVESNAGFPNDGQGIVWSSWLGKSYSLKHMEIMIRPYNYNRTFH